jgi:hypothetical protein
MRFRVLLEGYSLSAQHRILSHLSTPKASRCAKFIVSRHNVTVRLFKWFCIRVIHR